MMVKVGLEGWSVWVVYVLVGTMQIILIVMAVIFKIRDRKVSKEGNHQVSWTHDSDVWNRSSRSRASTSVSHAHSDVAPDEHSPLLSRE